MLALFYLEESIMDDKEIILTEEMEKELSSGKGDDEDE